MKYLLDTQLLVWGAAEPERFSPLARELLIANFPELWFSVASVWEIAIKFHRERRALDLDPRALREGLINRGYRELCVGGAHALGTLALPPIHKDPIDRMLVAQATVERITLLTTDAVVAQYPGPIELV
ncbi:MAG TPA: type II toxin-antitoxin system VapC family toxin [Terriglobales bacterium]|nr:type II toxin-antitoxin system VapC family toxin [Terriglobales bacterium]